jgi:hypothetical membrane protein
VSAVGRRFPAALDGQVAAGAACWVLTVLFFVGQAVVQATSRAPYGLDRSFISDLGNTGCGPYTAGIYHADVCAPLHDVMNGTFVACGLLVLLGAVLARRAWPRRRLTTFALALLVLGGAGQVLVGFRPENVDLGLHTLGAVFGIAGSDLAVLLLGIVLWGTSRWAALLSVLAGAIGLVCFVLTGSAAAGTVAVGVGTVERIAGYVPVVWMILVGAFLLRAALAERRPAPA